MDFSSDDSLVEPYRSPAARNVISDSAGMPEKRPGWRTIARNANGARVNGLWDANIEGKLYYIAHIGNGLYQFDPDKEENPLTLLYACNGSGRSAGINLCGKLWILTGEEYLVFDGTGVKKVSDSDFVYIPITRRKCPPAGGGVSYQSLNLLTGRRMNYFLGDGQSLTYQLETTDVDSVDRITINGTPYHVQDQNGNNIYTWTGDGVTTRFTLQGDYALAEISSTLTAANVTVDGVTATGVSFGSGTWTGYLQFTQAPEAGAKIQVNYQETYGYKVDLALGQVIFRKAPPAPAVGADENVFITFSKDITGYTDIVNHCTILSSFGVGMRDRIVLSGNPNYPNRDWTGDVDNPAYLPDLGYYVVGSEATAIMGYVPISSYMAIIKEDNGQDATIYMRSAGLSEDGEAVFPSTQSVSGVGAIAKGCIGLINDEPVFLNSLGLYAITSHIITAERIVQNRSYYVNAMLTKEPNLQDAICCRWNGYFIIGINNKCYILDGLAARTYPERNNANNFVYECYYWDNIPATCFLVHRGEAGEELWFGTADGRICRFNTDIEGTEKYADDGEGISAIWATKSDDDGDPTRLKTMLKQGAAVTLKPYGRSSGTVYFRTDRDSANRFITQRNDLFDFNEIDFERFSFNTNDAPQELFFRTKVKKYKRLQIIIRNDEPNEGFGIFGITKHYVVGNFARK